MFRVPLRMDWDDDDVQLLLDHKEEVEFPSLATVGLQITING